MKAIRHPSNSAAPIPTPIPTPRPVLFVGEAGGVDGTSVIDGVAGDVVEIVVEDVVEDVVVEDSILEDDDVEAVRVEDAEDLFAT